MKRVISIATAGVLALAALTVSTTAQDFNIHERTFLTFSNSVELPGTRLEPGTYVFRLADTPNRNIVQVLTEDEQEMLGQWIFIQAQRPEPSEETVITFRETSAGSTPAVQYWYYPGETIGKEFVYPKDQAMMIAQRTGASVMTDDGRINAQGAVAEENRAEAEVDAAVEIAEADVPEADVDASVNVAESEPREPAADIRADAGVTAQADDQAVGTSGSLSAEADVRAEEQAVGTSGSANVRVEEQAVGTSGSADVRVEEQAVGTSGAADVQAQQSQMPRSDMPQQQAYGQRELPRTASPLPISGLIALLSLAGAAGIRAFRQ